MRGQQVNPPPLEKEQLRQLLRWLIPITFSFSVLEGIAFVIFQDVVPGVGALILLCYAFVLLFARNQGTRGRWGLAIGSMCLGLLGATVVAAIIMPRWLPILVVTPLIAVMVALPYLSAHSMRYVLMASWLVTVIVAVIGQMLPPRSGLPAWFEDLFIICSVAAAVATVLLLLWQFTNRLTLMLVQTRAAEERYALAAQAANDGLWDWDLAADQLRFSARWKEMLGFEEYEVDEDPKEWFDRIHPDDRANVEERLEAHLKDGIPNFQSEYRMLHKDGTYRWMLARGVAVTDEKRRAIRMVGSQSDITERKHFEEELKQRAEELKASNEELERFAYVVAHDLRAPVHQVKKFASILLEDYPQKELDEEGRDYLRRICDCCDHVGGLIDGLLDLSRVTRTKMVRQSVNLSAVAGAIVDNLKRSQPEREVEFVVAKGIEAEGSPMLVWTALENLLHNAYKFTQGEPHPRIEFGANQQEDGEIVYFVRDNGIGLDPADAEKIFRVFERLERTKEQFEGSGIGLATVNKVIDLHGGQIWVDGTPGEGATFYFTLR